MDIIGPLHNVPQNERFIISLIDYHSKWPEICYTHNVTSEVIIEFLSSIFSREGFPDAIVTDNGPQFQSLQFETFLSQRCIQHLNSSVFYPQSNGQIERFNRVLKEHIQISQLEQRPLKQVLTECLASYRFSPQSTTGVSPAQLLHGRQPRVALDIVSLPRSTTALSPEQLRNRVSSHQLAMKHYVDNRRGAKPSKVRVGDVVKVRVPGKRPKYRGPYRVLQQVSPTSFRLSDGSIWNASRIVIFHTDSASTPKTSAHHSSIPSPYTSDFYMWPQCSNTSSAGGEDFPDGVAAQSTPHELSQAAEAVEPDASPECNAAAEAASSGVEATSVTAPYEPSPLLPTLEALPQSSSENVAPSPSSSQRRRSRRVRNKPKRYEDFVT
uniref:Gypsy-11 cq-i n=1 Tax=Rhipicephalus zambeziensis TaxID=60191 RepID=A0A224Z019_9ACAR